MLYQDHFYDLDRPKLRESQAWFNQGRYLQQIEKHAAYQVPFYIGETHANSDSLWDWTLVQYCLNDVHWSPWTYKTINMWGWGYVSMRPDSLRVNVATDSYETILRRWSRVGDLAQSNHLANIRKRWSNAARCVNTCNLGIAYTTDSGNDCISPGSILTTQVRGGEAPYHYQWSNTGTAAQTRIIPGQTLELKVSDARGCRLQTMIQAPLSGYSSNQGDEGIIRSIDTCGSQFLLGRLTDGFSKLHLVPAGAVNPVVPVSHQSALPLTFGRNKFWYKGQEQWYEAGKFPVHYVTLQQAAADSGLVTYHRGHFVGWTGKVWLQLDTLTLVHPGISVALSLQKVNGWWAGAAVRVRRSSDDTELDIGFDARGNLDTTALKQFVGMGNAYVSIWYDQSGNERHALQVSPGRQTRIVKDGIIERQNGQVTLRFIATDRTFFQFKRPIGGSDHSIWAMVRRFNTGRLQTLCAGPANASFALHFNQDRVLISELWQRTLLDVNMGGAGSELLQIEAGREGCSLKANGAEKGQAGVAYFRRSITHLGVNPNVGFVDYLDAQLATFIIHGAYLSAADLGSSLAYFKYWYGF